jgi:hypothetical protein
MTARDGTAAGVQLSGFQDVDTLVGEFLALPAAGSSNQLR